MSFNINNPGLKKGLGYAFAILSGLFTFAGVLADQQKDAEFEKMKQDIEALKENK